ncbi:hypothetical protein GCM10011390_32080 [Aureimonas endophytica]|uniref:O-antigen/teichoic acid export membrane protein n=1 Tax=Aureimonas endophytica TaxID=2027858 RepID=A0A916ZSM9_9HYPH|nr:hypothetical protein [Aureimonas endophytica]GGE10610.1 hypothetical protein GCM10011390_32080 [Aureimonas endophytica]
MRAAPAALLRRGALMLSGEMLQSAFHFALNIVLIHQLAPTDYGIFAIVMLMGGLALTYMRSLAGLPANLLIPAHAGRRRALPFEVTFGTVAALSALAMGLATAALLALWLRSDSLVAGGAFVALWALRSYLRSLAFAKGRQGEASLGDLTFALTGALLVAGFALGWRGADPLNSVFMLLAAANGAGILMALGLARRWPRLTLRRSMRRRYGTIGRQVLWSVLGTTTTNIQGQGQVMLIAACAGPAAYAPLAAMTVMFAPLRMLTAAIGNMVQPELARLWQAGATEAALRIARRWTLGVALVGILYGAVVVTLVPFLRFPVFDGQPVLLIGLLTFATALPPLFYLMPRLLLEVRRSFRLAAAIGLAGAAIGMGLVALILLVATPPWALVGAFASEATVLAGSLLAILRPEALRFRGSGAGAKTWAPARRAGA